MGVRRVCSTAGCPNLTDRGKCEDCARQKWANENLRKGSASARGYGRHWTVFAAAYKRKYPRCGDRHPSAPKTAHSRCAAQGRVSPAEITDHIEPIEGPDDPRFFDYANLQSLCRTCDGAKRAEESRR